MQRGFQHLGLGKYPTAPTPHAAAAAKLKDFRRRVRCSPWRFLCVLGPWNRNCDKRYETSCSPTFYPHVIGFGCWWQNALKTVKYLRAISLRIPCEQVSTVLIAISKYQVLKRTETVVTCWFTGVSPKALQFTKHPCEGADGTGSDDTKNCGWVRISGEVCYPSTNCLGFVYPSATEKGFATFV